MSKVGFSRDHTGSKTQGWDLNSGQPDSKACRSCDVPPNCLAVPHSHSSFAVLTQSTTDCSGTFLGVIYLCAWTPLAFLPSSSLLFPVILKLSLETTFLRFSSPPSSRTLTLRILLPAPLSSIPPDKTYTHTGVWPCLGFSSLSDLVVSPSRAVAPMDIPYTLLLQGSGNPPPFSFQSYRFLISPPILLARFL